MVYFAIFLLGIFFGLYITRWTMQACIREKRLYVEYCPKANVAYGSKVDDVQIYGKQLTKQSSNEPTSNSCRGVNQNGSQKE